MNTVTILNSTALDPVTYAAYSGQWATTPNIGYNPSGWVAKVVLAGITSVTGTVDGTKLTLSVTDPGYTSSGSATTVSRAINGIGPVIRQFEDPLINGPLVQAGTGSPVSQSSSPNANVFFLVTTDGTNLTLYIALDDWIYAGTTINSCTIASGFYTGYTASTPTVVNSSDLAYPSPIFAWHSPHYLSTNGTTSLYVEGLAFHRHAMGGKQVACIQYQATDAHSNSGAVATVGSTVLSAITTQGNIPEVWAANVDFTGLTQGDACTINAIVYPCLGNNPFAIATSGSISGQGVAWPTQRGDTLLHALCDNAGAYGGALAYVSSGGNDSTGVVSKIATTARATPFLTMQAAATALASFNNSTNGHNDLGGATIRLMDSASRYVLPATTNTGTQKTWFTIELDLLHTGTILVDGATSFTTSFPALTRFRGFQLNPTSGSGSYLICCGGSNGYLVFDGVTLNFSIGRNLLYSWNFNSYYNVTTNVPFNGLVSVGSNYSMMASGVVSTYAGGPTLPNYSSTVVGSILPYDTLGFQSSQFFNPNCISDFDNSVCYNNRVISIQYSLGAPPAWAASTAYNFGVSVQNGGKFYTAIGSGTSASSGGPTGTGASITDGSVTWKYQGTYCWPIPHGIAVVQNLVESDYGNDGNGIFQIFPDGDACTYTNYVDMHNSAFGGKCNFCYNDQVNSQIAPYGLLKQGTRRFTILDDQNIKMDGSAGFFQGCVGNISFAYEVGNFGNIALFGSVGRSEGTVPANQPYGGTAAKSIIVYMGLAWGRGGISNLLNVVGASYNNQSGYTAAAIMASDFVSYTTGPWGDPALFTQWAASTVYPAYSTVLNGSNCYTTVAGGTSGSTAPTHTTGTVSDGGVLWTFAHVTFNTGGNYAPTSASPVLGMVPAGAAVLAYDLAGNPRLNNGSGAAGAYELPSGGSTIILGVNGVMMALTYSSLVADTVLSGLSTPGLVPTNTAQTCQLVSNSTFNLTDITIAVAPQNGGTLFDPSKIYFAVCGDIDGTNSEEPRPQGSQPGIPGPIYQPMSDSGPNVNTSVVHRVVNVLSSSYRAFRLKLLNQTGVPLIITVNYSQA